MSDNKQKSDFAKIFDAIRNASDLDIPKITALFKTMTKAKLNHLEEEQILQLVAKKSGLPKTSLRKEYQCVKVAEGLLPSDVGTELAKKVMEDEFNGGQALVHIPSQGLHEHVLTHWVPLDETELNQRILPLVNKHKEWYPKRSSISVCREAVSCLKMLAPSYKPEQTLDPVINVRTHEIRLKKSGAFSLHPHNPDSFQFSCLPCDYDQKATAPFYEETMLQNFSLCKEPEEVLRHMYEFIGYSLQPVRFRKSVWFFIGGGDNGKSLAFKIIKALLGEGVHSCDMQTFQKDNFKDRALFGKLMLVDEDYKENLVLDTGFLKKQSENSPRTARSPHKMDNLDFQNTAAPLLIGNQAPLCTDTSHGWRTRVYVFPFERKLKSHEIDPERFEKIKTTELPGILNGALAGYARLIQRGGKFDVPEDCRKAADRMLENSNPLLLYLKDRLEPATGPHSHIHLRILKEDMLNWAEAQGIVMRLPGHLKGTLENMGYIIGPMGNANISGNALKNYRFKS